MLLKIEGDRAILHARPNPAIMSVLHQLEGRRSWLKAGGLSLEATPRNITIVSGLPGVEIQDTRRATEPAVEHASAFDVAREPYRGKRPLLPHQSRALGQAASLRVIALFMEQGTGKTTTLIERAGQLWSEGKITGVLVVSKKGVHRQWLDSELEEQFSADFDAAWWPISEERADELSPGSCLKWLSVNYDALRSKKSLDIIKRFCFLHQGRLFIIADESQEIKNYKSKRAKAMMELRPFAPYRALSTGTPIAKDLTDEWAQLRWLDENIIGIRYVTTFRSEYCIMGGFQAREVVAHKNVERFKELTAPYIFRAKKEELGLLPKQYKTWKFDLTSEQHRLLAQIKQGIEAELESGKIIDIKGAAGALIKAQQVASGFIKDETGAIHRLMPPEKNPRAIAMMEWLASDIDVHDKSIIWCRFQEDIDIVGEMLDNQSIHYVEYHGRVKQSDRDIAKKIFSMPGTATVFLANPQSAGTGLDGLQKYCRRAFYYTNSFNAVDRWQSEDRIHRFGTTGQVELTDAVATKSPDLKVVRNLRNKKAFSDWVLDDILSGWD